MADARGTPAGNSQLTIDRLELVVPGTTPGTTTVFISSSTAAPGGATTTGSSAPVNTSGSDSSTSSSPPVGAIVGGVLGGLALLIGVVIFVYWRRLRRANARAEAELGARSEPYIDPSVPRVTQFRDAPPVSTPPVTSSTASPWGGYGLSVTTGSEKAAAAARNNHQRMMPSITSVATSTQPPSQTPSAASATASGSGSGSGSTSPAIVPTPGLPRRERDAGPLPMPVEDEDEDEEETLPPEYGQVFARQPSTRRNRRTMPRIPDTAQPPRIEEKEERMPSQNGNEGAAS